MSLTIYTKPGCFPCRKTIEKFQDAGLIPQIVDISTTPAALEYITVSREFMNTEASKGPNSGVLVCPCCGESLGSINLTASGDSIAQFAGDGCRQPFARSVSPRIAA
ncbi:glutaredoxin domain-containing protein [Arthrobacter subterraneus]|uniref:glutaredoxin domain-containing protein n=1 Tax=Arthrobacter subterraneus TaxID=335973 RepID=UPI00380BC417